MSENLLGTGPVLDSFGGCFTEGGLEALLDDDLVRSRLSLSSTKVVSLPLLGPIESFIIFDINDLIFLLQSINACALNKRRSTSSLTKSEQS